MYIFLYSSDGWHLKPHKMTEFPFMAGRLIQVKITKKDKYKTATGLPLIQATNTVCGWAQNRDLQTGRPY